MAEDSFPNPEGSAQDAEAINSLQGTASAEEDDVVAHISTASIEDCSKKPV